MRRASFLLILVVGALTPLILTGCDAGGRRSAETVQILDLVVGQGPEVVDGDFVKIHYRCKPMKDDRQSGPLDDSRERDRPFVYQVGRGRVPAGWDEGITGMRAGGRRRIAVPPQLGYGAERVGQIEGSSTLVLEIELLALPRVRLEHLVDGEGPPLVAGDEVEIEYRGWLAPDGTAGRLFDSSAMPGAPRRFAVGREVVLPAWDQALPGLRRGDRVRLYVPADLGYGPEGLADGDSLLVPPDTDLIYEITVLQVTAAG